MRYEMSDFPPDPPSDAEDVRLTPASLRGHLQDLERRLFKARRMTIALQLTIALLLVALIVTVTKRSRGFVIEDDEGRPRIEASVDFDRSLLEFLDHDGVVRARLGERNGEGVMELYSARMSSTSEPAVELVAYPPRLTLRHEPAEVRLGLEFGGLPELDMTGREGRTVWFLREDPDFGVYEYRRRPPPPPGQ